MWQIKNLSDLADLVAEVGISRHLLLISSRLVEAHFTRLRSMYPELIEGGLGLEELFLVVEALPGEDVLVLVVHLHIGSRSNCVSVKYCLRFGHCKLGE